MTQTPRTAAEADLAFMRSIVEGRTTGRSTLTMGVAYLAGGLLYGLQCLFHVGQAVGVIAWPDLANLIFVASITIAFLIVLAWAVREDKKAGPSAPLVTRTLNAAFSGAGMANMAIIIVFGVGSARDQDFAVWLYYPAMIFALQAAAWYVAWHLKKTPWMLATSIGGWLTAVGLGVLVREPVAYLALCTAALFVLFAGPGAIMVRDALKSPAGRLSMGLADLGRIDEVIHGRMRLGIMVYLADVETADFTELKTVLEATQGNLSVHLKKLEEAGYVAIDKSFKDNKPLTRITLTGEGRAAFAAYLEALGRLIGDKG